MNPRNGFVVVKVGGRSFENSADLEAQTRTIAEAVSRGTKIVVVHGGGAQVSTALRNAGLEALFVDGLRVTDEAALRVMEPVASALGKALAHALSRNGAPALGLTGRDAALLEATVKAPALGRVGTITRVNVTLLRHLVLNGVTPVVGPIAVDHTGALNVNADEAAAAVAVALRARCLVLASDVSGVKDAAGNLLPRVTAEEARDLIRSGVATGGMVPKITSALGVLDAGVDEVAIVDGRDPVQVDAILRGGWAGTRLTGKLLPSPPQSVMP